MFAPKDPVYREYSRHKKTLPGGGVFFHREKRTFPELAGSKVGKLRGVYNDGVADAHISAGDHSKAYGHVSACNAWLDVRIHLGDGATPSCFGNFQCSPTRRPAGQAAIP